MFVKLYWQLCILDEGSFAVLPRSHLLDLANTMYSVIFEYTPEERLELFSDDDIDVMELEAAVGISKRIATEQARRLNWKLRTDCPDCQKQAGRPPTEES